MTPQLVPQQPVVHSDSAGSTHLTAEQFGELLAGSEQSATPEAVLAEAHLLACEQCATELAGLRQSIALFRDATSAYADEQRLHQARWVPRTRPTRARRLVPAYWAVATAAMLVTALLPMQVLRQRTHPAQPATVVSSVADRSTQSDEALLEDVDSEISASVPTPMQALADPTATTEKSVSTSTQRK